MKNDVLRLIVVAFVIKALYFVLAGMLGYGGLDALKRHDSYWYEKIATEGHSHITPEQLGKCDGVVVEQSYYAFFPLYPATVGGFIKLTSLGFDISAFIFSLIISVLLCFLIYKVALKLLNNERLAFAGSLLFLILPFNYYFSMYYTEGLFMVLLLASILSILEKRWWAMAFFASCMVLVRPNGFMVVPVLAILALENNETGFDLSWLKWSRIKAFPFVHFIIPTLVFLGYCYYLYCMTGDFFAFKTAQRGWCKETTMPWVAFTRMSSLTEYFQAAYFGLFAIVALWNIKKLRPSFNALIWIMILVPLMTGSITLPRFISILFVFPLVFATWTTSFKKYRQYGLYALIAALHFVSFYFWIINSEAAI